jgi:hypothetical protein
VNECDFLNHPPAAPVYCCDDNYSGVCQRGMLKQCNVTADCADANNVCVKDGGTLGACKPKGCLVDGECANGFVCDGEDQAVAPARWLGACRPFPHRLNNEPGNR